VHFAAMSSFVSRTRGCERHGGLPILEVVCTLCSSSGFCRICADKHSATHPGHTMKQATGLGAVTNVCSVAVPVSATHQEPTVAAVSLKARLKAVLSQGMDNCYVLVTPTHSPADTGESQSLDPAQAPQPSGCPLVACARHKTAAIHTALADLAGNEAAAMLQLERNREAFAELVAEMRVEFEARAADIHAAAAAKRAALEAEAVVADAVLEAAHAVATALTEVRWRLTLKTSADTGASEVVSSEVDACSTHYRPCPELCVRLLPLPVR
jgi:hypothetical protein